MKKLIMAVCLISASVAMASVDVYKFTTSIKYPAIGKTAFVPASTSVKGTLTIVDNSEATLVVTLAKTKQTYTLVAEGDTVYAVFGKKGTDCATSLKFVNEDPTEGLIELTFYGWGNLKTKKTGGCGLCGDVNVCSRMTSLKGVVGGKYICPCGGSFTEWDGSCDIFDDEVQDMAIYGSSATFTLKTVDGQKW